MSLDIALSGVHVAAKLGCKTTGIKNRIDRLFAVRVSLDLVL